MKWLEFSVYDDKCTHRQDYYDGCPLCREEKLQAEIDELKFNNEFMSNIIETEKDTFAKQQAEIDRLNHAINDEAVFGDHNIIPSMQAEIDGLTTRLNLLEEFCEKVQVHLPTMAKADLHHYFNTFGRLNQEKE